MEQMQIAIFAKRKNNKEGKVFYQFLTTLTRKDGTTETVRVAFRNVDGNEMPKPESCPRNIITTRDNSNVATRHYNDLSTGEVKTARTLWVSAWEPGSEYVDHSLDEYDYD